MEKNPTWVNTTQHNTKTPKNMSSSPRPRIISIEGNIGSGKSTLIEELKTRYANNPEIIFLQEPVDLWQSIYQESDGKTMLELFYENQSKYSFAFQVMAYMSRLRMIKEEVEKAMINGKVNTIVMERSMEADREIFAKMLYEDGLIEECMYKIYELMSNDGLKEFSTDGVIWLNTPPHECHKRIASRARHGEESIQIDYLIKCDHYHRDWLLGNTQYANNHSDGFIHIVDGIDGCFLFLEGVGPPTTPI